MAARPFKTLLFILGCTLAARAHAQTIPLETIDSIDAKVMRANAIATGKVADVSHTDKSTSVTIAVDRTLKGPASGRLTADSFQPRETRERWLVRSARMILFVPPPVPAGQYSPGAFSLKPMPLDEGGILGYRADFTPITDPKELIRTIETLVRKPALPTAETFRLMPPEGLAGETWLKSTGRTFVGGLAVPIDERLERVALERLRSKDYRYRIEAIQALGHFKTEANIRRLKGLLEDPYYPPYFSGEAARGIETRAYPVRQEAARQLKQWGVTTDKPILEETIDRLATIEELRFDGSLRPEDVQAIRGAKRLKRLTFRVFGAVPDGFYETIANSKELTELQMPEMSVDDRSLSSLGSLPKVTKLILDGNPLTNASIFILAGYKSLREISLRETEITDEGLANLRLLRPGLIVQPERAVSPMRLFVAHNDLEGVKRTLARDPSQVDGGWANQAAYNGLYDLTKLLLDRGAPLEPPIGPSVLQSAMVYYRPNPQVMELLIARGADVHRRDESGLTPIVKAAQSGNLPLMRLLLACGADPGDVTLRSLGYAQPGSETMDLVASFAALKRQPIRLVPQTKAACTRTAYALGQDDLGVWSSTQIGPFAGSIAFGTTPSGRVVFGPFGQQIAHLNLTDLPPHQNVHVEIELFVIGSWDGNGGLVESPDILDISVPGMGTLLHSTFYNPAENDAAGLPMQSFPDPYPLGFHPGYTGAAEVRTLLYERPWNGRDYRRDGVYELGYTFSHVGKTLQIDLAGLTHAEGEGSLAESEMWGLGRLIVKTD